MTELIVTSSLGPSENVSSLPQQPNIFPIFDKILQRGDKETQLKQKSKVCILVVNRSDEIFFCNIFATFLQVIWLTGLSGSGKSTIAQGLESILHQQGQVTMLLDGDNVRTGINKNLGFRCLTIA